MRADPRNAARKRGRQHQATAARIMYTVFRPFIDHGKDLLMGYVHSFVCARVCKDHDYIAAQCTCTPY